MSYHAGVGAGPGPVAKYKVDAPWPWGDDTEIAIPVQQMVTDAWTALQPKLDALENQLVTDIETEVSLYAPKLAKDLIDNIVLPELSKELEVTFAELDMMKTDVTRTVVIVGATMVLALGFGAWWVKKGR